MGAEVVPDDSETASWAGEDACLLDSASFFSSSASLVLDWWNDRETDGIEDWKVLKRAAGRITRGAYTARAAARRSTYLSLWSVYCARKRDALTQVGVSYIVARAIRSARVVCPVESGKAVLERAAVTTGSDVLESPDRRRTRPAMLMAMEVFIRRGSHAEHLRRTTPEPRSLRIRGRELRQAELARQEGTGCVLRAVATAYDYHRCHRQHTRSACSMSPSTHR